MKQYPVNLDTQMYEISEEAKMRIEKTATKRSMNTKLHKVNAVKS